MKRQTSKTNSAGYKKSNKGTYIEDVLKYDFDGVLGTGEMRALLNAGVCEIDPVDKQEGRIAEVFSSQTMGA
jgi:hypothetical protein